VTDTSTADARGSGRAHRPAPRRGNPASRFLGSITLFVSQIIDELRKVVRPTRHELVTYTSVLIVFVAVIMMYVFGLDTLFTKLVLWVFGG
jgi:preprotein translocase subunit SecE